MRDLPNQLEDDLQEEVTTLCRLWRITRRDGATLFLTDLDADIVFGGNTYRYDIGFTASAILMALDTKQQGLELEVFLERRTEDSLTDRFYLEDIEGKLYDGAVAQVSIVNYMFPTHGETVLFGGRFGAIIVEDGRLAKITVNALDAGDRSINTEVYSVTCRADLGDGRCQVDIEALKSEITITTLGGDQRVISTGIAEELDHWQDGTILWLTGNNEGRAYEIATSIVGQAFLFLPTQFPIKIGDTAILYPGCNFSLSTCRDKYDNVVNFRGEPFVPGENEIPGDNGVTE